MVRLIIKNVFNFQLGDHDVCLPVGFANSRSEYSAALGSVQSLFA